MGTIQAINLEATRSTPEIRFDPAANRLSIDGQSYPENAFAFYQPLLQWIDDYFEQLAPGIEVSVELQLPYINTTSTKCLLMLLDKLQAAYEDGLRVAVRWLYDEDNESELECAEEFKEDLTLPFQIIPKTAEQ
ncbi:DUF1987 domain-containing protein [Cohnella panacarvi]|uniref:DUF1987 domain-containing protein n=1 Tax=Cohnella panacarvi TaxID=400776 RepID=UPI00047CD14B|nr:DUF1987 domain-containing protein [Cohnella panacarvi]